MKRVRFVFVNWKTRDIVSTSSNPGYPHVKTFDRLSPARKAKKLLESGYVYYGLYKGWDITIIWKKQ